MWWRAVITLHIDLFGSGFVCFSPRNQGRLVLVFRRSGQNEMLRRKLARCPEYHTFVFHFSPSL